MNTTSAAQGLVMEQVTDDLDLTHGATTAQHCPLGTVGRPAHDPEKDRVFNSLSAGWRGMVTTPRTKRRQRAPGSGMNRRGIGCGST
jgi:hypothetical protein